MNTNNYNRIAWCYDLLCRLVFGNAIKKAQIEMLDYIPVDSRILIAGGGTGWILEEITNAHSSGVLITYIDASEKMIQRAKNRYTGLNEIKFIVKPIEEVDLAPVDYDVIITSFFFDNFPQSKCYLIFQQLNTALKKDGVWLFSDFKITNNGKYWQRQLLKLMYLFFKITCMLQAIKLPDINILFFGLGYKKISEKLYYSNFITSIVFRKA